jgi:hypothetical protein
VLHLPQQVDVRPTGQSSLRVTHSFDAHFDAAAHSSPSAPAPLHIEEMGRPGSGDFSDGPPPATAPARLLSLGASQQSMAVAQSAVPHMQHSGLAPQGSAVPTQTDWGGRDGNGAAPVQQQLSQPALASVNNSLYRNMAGWVASCHAPVASSC